MESPSPLLAVKKAFLAPPKMESTFTKSLVAMMAVLVMRGKFKVLGAAPSLVHTTSPTWCDWVMAITLAPTATVSEV